MSNKNNNTIFDFYVLFRTISSDNKDFIVTSQKGYYDVTKTSWASCLLISCNYGVTIFR